VVELPVNEAYQRVIVELGLSVGAVLIIAILAAVAGSYLSRRLAAPLRNLTDTATHIAEGQLEQEAAIEGTVEVRRLAGAFNSMTGELRKTLEGLEQRVEARTEELRQLQEGERQLAEESALLSQVGQIVSSTLDIDEVYERFAAELKKLVDFDRLAINIIDHEAGVFVFRYASGLVQPGRQVPDVVPLQGTQTEHVIATGKPFIRGDIASDPYARDELSIELGFRSTIMAPVFHKGRILATLSLRSRRVDAYGSREQSILERLSEYIAPAIENAELYSQRTKAEEALRESEAKYRSIFDESKDTIFITAREGQVIDANESAVELFGYEMNELLGLTVGEMCVLPEDHRRLVEEVNEQGSIKDYEIQLRKKDGTELDCLVSLTVHRDPNGEILVYQGMVRDITEHKRAEETLLQHARELAVLEERNRMAREIHDTLAQGFTGIFLQLEAGEQALSDSPDEVVGHLSKAKILARESLQEARRSVWDLLPHALEQLDLVDALQKEVDQFAAAGGEQAALIVAGEIRELMPTVQTAILRICQESLTNVRRHAEANRVDVTLTFQHKAVHLAVQDDGQGFEVSGVAPESEGGGFGLIGMGQRAKQLDGALEVKSAKGKGALVEVTIPTL